MTSLVQAGIRQQIQESSAATVLHRSLRVTFVAEPGESLKRVGRTNVKTVLNTCVRRGSCIVDAVIQN